MSKIEEYLTDPIQDFIKKQPLFFTGTAASTGSVNVSPKGMDSLRIVDHKTILWLNLTGSGNETAAHVLQNPRITLMWCSFDEKPLILRVYGKAVAYELDTVKFKKYSAFFPNYPGSRQIFEVNIERVQSSCGFAVPRMDLVEERTMLTSWAAKQGKEKLVEYRTKKNAKSIDGFDTK
ncbi:pyridoxamine 5'-phosphate oxidase family protein [Aquimarina sp. ERC-38]|uniref:pyridoxamine 5'-phosphate oxidase family protein n=1 Tax=Aquimarina sp. ERC-38 TaxID=2949996 RepID=UPI002246DA7D|nr:pyridoxamine 5'-phosphate oxidase family protein [Aquimarina sp. ERC-38]UZO80906.1 pyridoxamine 5'-phosphate oxidase family protein [Aquimarina sp. ERC-38]